MDTSSCDNKNIDEAPDFGLVIRRTPRHNIKLRCYTYKDNTK
jgi:hypothetical protein